MKIGGMAGFLIYVPCWRVLNLTLKGWKWPSFCDVSEGRTWAVSLDRTVENCRILSGKRLPENQWFGRWISLKKIVHRGHASFRGVCSFWKRGVSFNPNDVTWRPMGRADTQVQVNWGRIFCGFSGHAIGLDWGSQKSHHFLGACVFLFAECFFFTPESWVQFRICHDEDKFTVVSLQGVKCSTSHCYSSYFQ